MQARKSMPAEPAVACCGQRKFPADARIQNPQLDLARHASAAARRARTRSRGRAAALRRLREPRRGLPSGGGRRLGDQGDELARDVDFRSARDFDLAARPNDGERIVLAIERNAVADLVGGDHVELLALELAARVVLDVVGFGGESDHEGAAWPCPRPT